jgi:broad specificity phosphatase PhoE
MGPFDHVVVSPIPRTAETAIAMGFAVDELCEALGPSDPALFAEIGHHERWSWESPFLEFARLARQGGVTTHLGLMVAEAWRSILDNLLENGRALAISHGRVIECGLVTIVPDAQFAAWGIPFRPCEGARITDDGRRGLRVELLRIELGEPC